MIAVHTMSSIESKSSRHRAGSPGWKDAVREYVSPIVPDGVVFRVRLEHAGSQVKGILRPFFVSFLIYFV